MNKIIFLSENLDIKEQLLNVGLDIDFFDVEWLDYNANQVINYREVALLVLFTPPEAWMNEHLNNSSEYTLNTDLILVDANLKWNLLSQLINVYRSRRISSSDELGSLVTDINNVVEDINSRLDQLEFTGDLHDS